MAARLVKPPRDGSRTEGHIEDTVFHVHFTRTRPGASCHDGGAIAPGANAIAAGRASGYGDRHLGIVEELNVA